MQWGVRVCGVVVGCLCLGCWWEVETGRIGVARPRYRVGRWEYPGRGCGGGVGWCVWVGHVAGSWCGEELVWVWWLVYLELWRFQIVRPGVL